MLQGICFFLLACFYISFAFQPTRGRMTMAVGNMSPSNVYGDPSKWKRPRKIPIVYDYEQSPNCKKVREACCLLDLVVEYRPCPGARYGFADQLNTRTLGSPGRDRTCPYLADVGNPIGTLNSMFDSDEICQYLFEYYGPGKDFVPANCRGQRPPSPSSLKPLANYNEGNIFKKPLDLWGIEGSSETRPVRETLNNLALAHRMVYVAKGSKNIEVLTKKLGTFQIPYLEDPNTGKKLTGTKEINAYLLETYTKK